MVHALQALNEAWRVLKPGGVVCDIHPMSGYLPFEVVQGDTRISVGFVDLVNSPSDSFDRAMVTTQVLGIACYEGRFGLEKQALFTVQYSWAGIEDLMASFGDVVSKVTLGDGMIGQIAEAFADVGGGGQVVMHRTKVIGRYRKVGM